MDEEFVIDGKFASFPYIRRLYDFQSNSMLPTVHVLTKRHIEPTNIKRQNVQLALDRLSSERGFL